MSNHSVPSVSKDVNPVTHGTITFLDPSHGLEGDGTDVE